MTFNQTVINSILEYPSLYKDIDLNHSIDKVINHLFFTNGNGYEWENGELVCESDTKELLVIPEDYFSTSILSKEEEESDYFKKLREEFKEEYKPHGLCSKGALTIYPICEFARILSIPDDIKDDWLLAADKACILAFDYFSDPYKHCMDVYIREWVIDREYSKIKKYLEKQLQYVYTAVDKINSIEDIRRL